MSVDALAHLQAGLDQGLDLEDLQAALQILRAGPNGAPTVAPPRIRTTHDETVAWLEDHREDDGLGLLDAH